MCLPTLPSRFSRQCHREFLSHMLILEVQSWKLLTTRPPMFACLGHAASACEGGEGSSRLLHVTWDLPKRGPSGETGVDLCAESNEAHSL